MGLGGVTHQVIGYLWPMGPFYWFFDAIGVPDWLAQRLWLGSLMFAAGAGVLYLLRTLGWPDRPAGHDDEKPSSATWWDAGMVVAALAYALSPYVLDYAARISVILLPWAGLPWLIAFLARAIRVGGWRYPAAFALVTLTISSTNLTSVVLVGIGPILWVAFAVWIEREVPFRQALGAVWRTGLLTVGVSLWWFVGLVVEGRYGIPIVRYTETYQAVAVASTTPEVIRGLGYWFFYGNDKLGQWIVPSIHYMRYGIPLSFALPIFAFLAGALTRFRHRLFFITLIVIGAVDGGRRSSLRRSVTRGWPAGGLDPDRHRARLPEHGPRAAVAGAGDLGPPRRGRRRPGAPTPPLGHADRGAGGDPGHRQPACALGRSDGRPEPAP